MNIYVGSLPFETTEEYLQVPFTEYGQVSSARVVTARRLDRSGLLGGCPWARGLEVDKRCRPIAACIFASCRHWAAC